MHMCSRLFLLTVFFTASIIQASPEILRPLTLKGGTDNNILSAMALSPDGSVQAVAYGGRGIYVWEGQQQFSRRIILEQKIRSLDVDAQKNLLVGMLNGQVLYFSHESDTPLVLMENRGPVLSAKWGADTQEFYVLYQSNKNLSGEKYIVKISGNAHEKSIKMPDFIRNFSLNTDKSMIITSSYDTNNSKIKNRFLIIDTQNLQGQYYDTANGKALQSFFGALPQSLGTLQGNKLSYSAHQTMGELIEKDILAAGYFSKSQEKKDTLLLVLGDDQTVRFINPRHDEASASIWPFFSTDILLSLDGKKVLSFDDSQDLLQLWTIEQEATESYSNVLSSTDYKNLPLPEKKPRYGENDVECFLRDGKVFITNRSHHQIPSYYAIYWYTFDQSGELLENGKYSSGLAINEEIGFDLHVDGAKRCSASYFTERPNGP